jgi:hypothetical protein
MKQAHFARAQGFGWRAEVRWPGVLAEAPSVQSGIAALAAGPQGVVGCRQRPKDQIAIIGTEYRGSKMRRAALFRAALARENLARPDRPRTSRTHVWDSSWERSGGGRRLPASAAAHQPFWSR